MYNRPLAEHLCSETSSDFRRLLTLIVTGVRDESGATDADKATECAEKLYAAGEAKLGTDEEVFNRIMAHSSFEQLRLIFEEYKKLSGKTIEQAIKNEIGGELKEAMLAIGKMIWFMCITFFLLILINFSGECSITTSVLCKTCV